MNLHNIIDNLNNIQFVILGLSISVFTLLFSFIINKRDELFQLLEQNKNGIEVDSYSIKIKNAKLFLKNYKQINNLIIKVFIFSIFLIGVNLLKSIIHISILLKIIITLNFFNIICVLILIFKILIYYKKITKF